MNRDAEILKRLGAQVAQIAVLPVQDDKKKMWRAHNGLQMTRPMVCIDQLPWHELNVTDELTLLCEDEFLRDIEQGLRRQLYKWKHFPADMVIENRVDIPKTIYGLNYGLTIIEETLATQEGNDIVSHKYADQCETEESLAELRPDEIRADKALDKEHKERCEEIFKGIIPVRLSGVSIHAGVWDRIAQARPLESILFDIVDRPEFIQMVAKKFLELTMSTVDQCEALGLLDAEDPLVHCTGAYVDELPTKSCNPDKATAKDCWTFAMAQIFATVGPDTHEEFEIDIMKPLFERFGLLYYGCCEPLHQKIDIIRKIKNVRKISISPWAKIDESAERIGGDYVFSGKAHPAYVASGVLETENIKTQVTQMIEACKRNHTPCEIILKDISTVNNNPQVLTEWEKLLMEIAGR
ncbi:MAG: hypothetical protein FWG94_12065 [Oscillospiraceae bacterium]|nr:hypothetical protein [Oscillospiraceae bacterium]